MTSMQPRRKQVKPRNGSFYGMPIHNIEFPDGTWLEGEEFAYPAGGFTRRCFATFDDGSRRVVRCSIPDTYTTIPARARVKGRYVKGYVTSMVYGQDVEGMRFHEFEPQAEA
jgi:hypothetical protein